MTFYDAEVFNPEVEYSETVSGTGSEIVHTPKAPMEWRPGVLRAIAAVAITGIVALWSPSTASAATRECTFAPGTVTQAAAEAAYPKESRATMDLHHRQARLMSRLFKPISEPPLADDFDIDHGF